MTNKLNRRLMAAAAVTRATGIDAPMIATLVERFYDRVRTDQVLAPIFAAQISDWPAHLARMRDFWSSVTLLSGSYHGRPMDAHRALPIGARHFAHWLELFEHTAHDVCPPAAATHFIACARRIAASLERAVRQHWMTAAAPRLQLRAPFTSFPASHIGGTR